MKRLYKFYSDKWALDAVKKRRLKVATLDDLNDPFEFIADTTNNADQRRLWHKASKGVFSQNGLISFSRSCKNPVLWSHYADRHRGVAIGFDVRSEFVVPVVYRKGRPTLPDLRQMTSNARRSAIELTTRTKFLHWEYEAESRVFVKLDAQDEGTGLYFKAFGSDLVLREVILGVRSELTSQKIHSELGPQDVKITTARLAFKTYSVVAQRNPALQK